MQALVDSGPLLASCVRQARGRQIERANVAGWTTGQFNLLAAKVDGTVAALRSRSEIDPTRIGLLGPPPGRLGGTAGGRSLRRACGPSRPWWTRPFSSR